MFDVPELRPTNMFAVPATLSTRKPAMLNWVVASTKLPESVPPAVPFPEMLKLLDACWTFVF